MATCGSNFLTPRVMSSPFVSAVENTTRWQQHVTTDMVRLPAIASALCRVAMSMSNKITQETQSTHHSNWISWINEGPASGLRRQHRMSRVAIGWIRSKDLSPDADLSRDDDDDGPQLSYNDRARQLQWDRVIPNDSCSPMSLQQTVDDQGHHVGRSLGMRPNPPAL